MGPSEALHLCVLLRAAIVVAGMEAFRSGPKIALGAPTGPCTSLVRPRGPNNHPPTWHRTGEQPREGEALVLPMAQVPKPLWDMTDHHLSLAHRLRVHVVRPGITRAKA